MQSIVFGAGKGSGTFWVHRALSEGALIPYTITYRVVIALLRGEFMKRSLLFSGVMLSVLFSCVIGVSAAGQDKRWVGWKEARSDYGYLPGTQFTENGTSGFKVYYRCGNFKAQQDGGRWKVGMDMVFGNDKGGDLGIVTWTNGPSREKVVLHFLGYAQQYGLPDGAALDDVQFDMDTLCENAYRTVDSQRKVVALHLLKKDFKALAHFYAAAKFIPGPIGTYASLQELAITVAEKKTTAASVSTLCLVSGVVLEKGLHKFGAGPILHYAIEKSCDAGTTAVDVAHEMKEAEEELKHSLTFTGTMKARISGTYYGSSAEMREKMQAILRNQTLSGNSMMSRLQASASAPKGPSFVSASRTPDASANVTTAKGTRVEALLRMAYVAPEDEVKNIFFDKWR